MTILKILFSKTAKPLKTKDFFANASFVWEGRVLPMNYTCIKLYLLIIAKPGPKCKHFFSGGFDFFLPGGTGEGGREKISVTRKKVIDKWAGWAYNAGDNFIRLNH